MSNKLKYDSYGNSIDGTDYCTGVETFAQNLIEDNSNDASITFPAANGWAKPRTKNYILTTNNCDIILPQNIYKLQKVVMATDNLTLSHFDAEATNLHTYGTAKEFLGIDELNITSLIVEQTVFNALQVAKNFAPDGWQTQDETCDSNFKDNTFIYNANSNIISINPETWKNLVVSAVRRAGFGKSNANYYEYQKNNIGDKKANIDPRTFKFRVSYIPMSSDIKIRARKSAKQNADYIQPINQRAEINSASALGKFLYNTAQKMGTEQITLVKWYTKIADIPPLGCRVRHNGQHYILTANSIEMTNCVQVKVTHTLSKNWSNKSQYVSVDQKYRNYKIPADILWRNMHWEDYIEVTTDGVVQNAEAGDLTMSVIEGSTTKRAIIPRIFLCDKTDDVTITSFFLYRANRESYDKGVTVPCTTMGIANSMVFSASMKDNLSAGLRVNADNSQYCEEVFYCYDNGKLDYARFVLSGGVNITDEGAYPQSALGENQPTDKVFDEIFYVSKDPGEALKFTYQCHWISDEADVVIGSKLAENHPLVKKWTENRKFRFWFLKKPLRQGEDKLLADETRNVLITTDEQRKGYFGMQDLISDTQKAFKLTLAQGGVSLLNGSDIKAWAITDENNNLYIGCNDKSKTTLYFTHIHERK